MDIINATIDSLIQQQVELPAFSTLDAIVEQVHTRVQTALFRRVSRRLSDEDKVQLDRLVKREFNQRESAYNTIKRYALPSMTFLRNTGSICERPIRLSRPLPPFDIEQPALAIASRARPSLVLHSSSSSQRNDHGDAFVRQKKSPRCSEAFPSRTDYR
ncbi:hypothetical protein HDG37_007834 [Paraburkholderia sp. MM5384-R2]|nr:hypothetical protein [Paraburkholderia sp. MM5384-R2]